MGTGPGDPELLTPKAMRAMKMADLVQYDRLVSNHVLELVRDDVRLLYVGKTTGYHSRTQEEIHELLLSFAEAGANVVRLNGGDPMISHPNLMISNLKFGHLGIWERRGGDGFLAAARNSSQGYSRNYIGFCYCNRAWNPVDSLSVRFLTGHSRNGGTYPLYVAKHAADPDSTLAIYMGLPTLPALVPKLVNHRFPPDTPAVAVERGTTPQQRTMIVAGLKGKYVEAMNQRDVKAIMLTERDQLGR